MPSVSSKASQPNPQATITSDLLQEPLKHAVSVMEKKQRNLEKRKIKLLETKKKAAKGNELNDDQRKAIENLIMVEAHLDLIKELHKNMALLDTEYGKLLKKDQKRLKLIESQHADALTRQKVVNIVEVQTVLGALTDEVRPDFLAGKNGACQLSEDELKNMDSLYELVNIQIEDSTDKLSVHINSVSDHLIKVSEGKDTAALENGTTYKDIKVIVVKILESGYFDKEIKNGVVSEEIAVEEESAEEELVEKTQEQFVEASSPSEEAVVNPTGVVENPEKDAAITPEVTGEAEPEGVDLPPEVQDSPCVESINFLSESEISIPVDSAADIQQASLNPVSPEFVPRTFHSPGDEPSENGVNSDEQWEQAPPAESDWKSVPDNQNVQNAGGYRGNRGGRGGRGFGGRGGGRGRGAGSYRGGNRQDGGGYRGGNRSGRGEYRGNRGGGGEYRGGRGGNGEHRGRGGGEYRGRGGNRGNRGGRDNREQNQ